MRVLSRAAVLAAIVSCGAAAVTAAVMTGAPAAGAARLGPATAAPVIIQGSKGLAVISGSVPGWVRVAKLPMPAGRWAIFAKADASSEVDGPTLVRCSLNAGTNHDFTGVELESGATSAFVENIAMNTSHRFTGRGSVVLRCNSSGVTVDMTQIKITAIKAGTLTSVKLK